MKKKISKSLLKPFLLNEPRLDSAKDYNHIFANVCTEGNVKLAGILLQSPIFDPTDAFFQATKTANSEINQLLLSDPRVEDFASCIEGLRISDLQ